MKNDKDKISIQEKGYVKRSKPEGRSQRETLKDMCRRRKEALLGGLVTRGEDSS